jgi:hypothetical protein
MIAIALRTGKHWSFRLTSLVCLLVLACSPDAASPTEATAFTDLPDRADDYAQGIEQWGYLDSAGVLVIAPTFDDNRPFREGRAVVRRGGRFGYIDREGREIIPLQFSGAYSFHEGRARIRATNDSVGFIDREGSTIIPPSWSEAGDFSNGYAWVRRDEAFGYVDRNGRLQVALSFSNAEDFGADDRAIVAIEDKYGMIDTTGRLLIPGRYERLYPFREGLARARESNRYGYIDPTGAWILPPAFAECSDFRQGLTAIAPGRHLRPQIPV